MNNTNPVTGIPYGTIYLNHLNPDIASDLWTNGKDLSYEEAYTEVRLEVNDAVDAGEIEEDDFDSELDARAERIQIDEPTIEGECEGVKYHISWLGGAPLLWVFESPHTGFYQGCSPCIPGAGDLESPANPFENKVGFVCYDVPYDWRAKG